MHILNEQRQRVADLRAECLTLNKELVAAVQADPSSQKATELKARYEAKVGELDNEGGKLHQLERLAEEAANYEPLVVSEETRRNYNGTVDPARTGGFASLPDLAVAVQRACSNGGLVDDRLAALRRGGGALVGAPPSASMNEGGSEDGYMVPPEFREEIWRLFMGGQDLINRMPLTPTSRNSVQELLDDTTPWGTTGIQAYWEGEGDQATASRPKTKPTTVTLEKLMCFVVASDELLEDAPRLNSRLGAGAAEAMRWKASEGIMNGNGTGQPQGYYTSGALVTAPKVSGQAADTIVAGNIGQMYSQLIMSGIQNAFWIANSDTLPQLMTMTIGDQPVWRQPNDLKDAPGGLMMGRPMDFSEHCQTLGDKGDLHLINPRGYMTLTKSGTFESNIQFASSIHLYFDYQRTAFRWTFRMGGQPRHSAPITPPNSTAQKSHFVTLAVRS